MTASITRKPYLAAAITITLGLAGCASDVKPQYVSPAQYQSFSCDQLHSEYDRINHPQAMPRRGNSDHPGAGRLRV